MDDENAEDEPAETPEDDWKRNTFYVSVDTIINSLRNRVWEKPTIAPSIFVVCSKPFPTACEEFQNCTWTASVP